MLKKKYVNSGLGYKFRMILEPLGHRPESQVLNRCMRLGLIENNFHRRPHEDP